MQLRKNWRTSDGDATVCSRIRVASLVRMRWRYACWQGVASSPRCIKNGWRWGSSLLIWRKGEGLREPAETQKNDTHYDLLLYTLGYHWTIILTCWGFGPNPSHPLHSQSSFVTLIFGSARSHLAYSWSSSPNHANPPNPSSHHSHMRSIAISSRSGPRLPWLP